MIEFDKAFEALTGHAPLRWQVRLFDRLSSGVGVPRVCDLPTGLGKTAVIPIWTIALAQQAAGGHVTLPRRLVYIVNRRTVVDQATSVVERIRGRLLKPCKSDWAAHEDVLCSLASSLRNLSPEPPLLAVSTLRGELADNEEWKDDPARAAIIVGTIDMIGSKLLFSGYGDGRYKRTHHAGLIGQDTLLVHDEAHLTPAFSDLLGSVERMQTADCESRPIRIMELSATQRGDGESDIYLGDEDELDAVVRTRLDAKKQLHLHSSARGKQVQQLVGLVHDHDDSQAKVLVYVRTPGDAQKIANALEKKLGKASPDRVALLTGTIRGRERDRLVDDDPVYAQMLDPDARPDRTVYLVSTSAGEVGIDIDADHMVCDLTTLDSMIQRLGRVNRRGGEGRKARVDVVWTEKDEKTGNGDFAQSITKTLDILRHWEEEAGGAIDASPRNMRRLIQELSSEDRTEAFSPKPSTPSATDILFDAWALTSINDMPGRPDVAPYLHGQASDPPETYIAWRGEVSLFSKHDVDETSIRHWFASCRIRAEERLPERTDRVKSFLRNLLKELGRNGGQVPNAVLLNRLGNAQISPLPAIIEDAIEYKTIVLPVEAGGLEQNGTLNHEKTEPIQDIDVGDSHVKDLQR